MPCFDILAPELQGRTFQTLASCLGALALPVCMTLLHNESCRAAGLPCSDAYSSCTYLAHHELESIVVFVAVIVVIITNILMMLTGNCLPGLACVTSVSEILTNALALGIVPPSCWPDVCDCEIVLGARPPDVTCGNNNPVCVDTLHGCRMNATTFEHMTKEQMVCCDWLLRIQHLLLHDAANDGWLFQQLSCMCTIGYLAQYRLSAIGSAFCCTQTYIRVHQIYC